jgi:hypothetical protein
MRTTKAWAIAFIFLAELTRRWKALTLLRGWQPTAGPFRFTAGRSYRFSYCYLQPALSKSRMRCRKNSGNLSREKARNGSPDLELELEWGMRDGTVRAALLSLSTGRVMRVTMKSHEAENIIARVNASRRSGKNDI